MKRWLGEIARRSLRTLLPYSTYVRIARAYGERVSARRFGSSEYRRLMALRDAPRDGEPQAFIPVGGDRPLWVRPGTTDPIVFEHTLIRHAYSCYSPAHEVRFVLDAGANAGFTAAYFLQRFPQARLAAIEPDSGNLDAARRNLADFGERVRLVPGGLWPVRARLRVVMGDGEHGIRVTPVRDGEPFDCEAYDPLTLLRESGAGQIDLFKCDIEGAETPLFASGCDPWLERTRAIMIELHNDEAIRTVYSACRRHGFRDFRYRELHVFFRA
jgi:FkbM family methyltransferase